MSVIWAPNSDGEYSLSSVEKSSKFKNLVRKTSIEKLTKLAADLTQVVQQNSCTRWNLASSRGECLRNQKQGLENVLKEAFGSPGEIVDYKVVGVNTQSFEAGGITAVCGALFFPLSPILWIKFSLL
jgi:hypothetical protein